MISTKALLVLAIALEFTSTTYGETYAFSSTSGSIADACAVFLRDRIFILPGQSSEPAQTLPATQPLRINLSPNAPIGPVTSIATTTYTALSGHAAAMSDDGSILIIGGLLSSNSSDYHRATTYTTTTTSMSTPTLFLTANMMRRLEHTLTPIGGSDFLLLSGHNGTGIDGLGMTEPLVELRDISLFNPVGTLKAAPPVGWWQHTATWVQKRYLIVLGGVRTGGQLESMTTINIYDATTNSWKTQNTSGIIPASRRDHAAVADAGGVIYISGGTILNGTSLMKDVYSLDTTTWRWRSRFPQAGELPGRRGHAAFFLPIGIGAIGIALGQMDTSTSNVNEFVSLMETYELYPINSISGGQGVPGTPMTPATLVLVIVFPILGVVALGCLAYGFYVYRRRKLQTALLSNDTSWPLNVSGGLPGVRGKASRSPYSGPQSLRNPRTINPTTLPLASYNRRPL